MANPLNVAAPLASVVAVDWMSVASGKRVELGGRRVTKEPTAGFAAPSRTRRTGGCPKASPLVAVGDGWVVLVTCVAVPAPSVIVPEVAGVRLPLSNRSV